MRDALLIFAVTASVLNLAAALYLFAVQVQTRALMRNILELAKQQNETIRMHTDNLKGQMQLLQRFQQKVNGYGKR